MQNDLDRKTGQRTLDEAWSEVAGHYGLDFVGEMAKRLFLKLWYDKDEREKKLLELER